jgi:hypothetical protein
VGLALMDVHQDLFGSSVDVSTFNGMFDYIVALTYPYAEGSS